MTSSPNGEGPRGRQGGAVTAAPASAGGGAPPPLPQRVPTAVDTLGRPTDWLEAAPGAAADWDARLWRPVA